MNGHFHVRPRRGEEAEAQQLHGPSRQGPGCRSHSNSRCPRCRDLSRRRKVAATLLSIDLAQSPAQLQCRERKVPEVHQSSRLFSYNFIFCHYPQASTVVSGLKSTAALVSNKIVGQSKTVRVKHPMDCNPDAGLDLLQEYRANWAELQSESNVIVGQAKQTQSSIKRMRNRVQATSSS